MARRVPKEAAKLIASYSEPFVCQSCLSRWRQTRKTSHGHAPSPYRLLRTVATQQADLNTQAEVPLRKQLKDEAKLRKLEGASKPSTKSTKRRNSKLDQWELTVGIEIHAELNTERKLFSSAATSLSDAPNTHVALFDLALPGTQPQFQKETLLPAIRAAIALNCEIQRKSSFDRKHYFYQDQPNGYQITQYYEPYAKAGHITLHAHDGIDPADGDSITIGIKQIQMEQDTAKTIHQPPDTYLLDFNRVSHPLIEIITLPEIHYPATAAALVRKVQTILKAVDANTTGMEMGGLRADVNVSVRRRQDIGAASPENRHSYHGVSGLGQRTEIKNLNSFKAVEDAIIAERDRQIGVLEGGGTIEGETRGWTLRSTETTRLRGKEGEVDYRYMPDPDLGPVVIGEDLVQHLRDTLPMLPDAIATMLTEDGAFGLTMKDAKTLIGLDDGDRLEYFLEVRDTLITAFEKKPKGPTNAQVSKTCANCIIHDLPDMHSIPASTLAEVLLHVLAESITYSTAKRVLTMIPTDTRTIATIIKDEGFVKAEMSDEAYTALAQSVITANEHMVKDLQKGSRSEAKRMWLVGQMLRSEKGLDPERARKALWSLLDAPP